MTTPGRPAPRLSGIPTPGSRSGIPMPGRPRSSTGTNTTAAPRSSTDTESMSKALQDAIRANDPIRYSSSESLSPQLSSASVSGRRSVAGIARPPSAASTSSGISSRMPSEQHRVPPSRSKTPVSATSATGRAAFTPRASMVSRPESRSSHIGRSLSRAGQEFEVGDSVRIESLGMEGTLQFMGEIQGKSGIWAGVELAPGFVGRGKNDGSVNGIHYFTCAPKCGVFTLPNKLSAATGGRNVPPRPMSVNSMASSYGGRTTPSFSGRTTPSHAPTPLSDATPLANPRKKGPFETNPESQITAGSRASKYIGMSAHELGTRNGSGTASTNSSPTRSASTPQGTPKAPRGLPAPRTRPSLGLATPKALGRPLTSMAPPPLPMGSPRRVPRPSTATPTLSQGSSETFVDDTESQNGHSVMSALDMNDKAIQEKIALLMSSTRSPVANGSESHAELTESALGSPIARRTPDSSALEARIARLEQENDALKAEVGAKSASIAEEAEVLNAAIERAVALEEDKKVALARVTELERTHERALKDQQDKLDVLERASQASDKARADLETRIKEEEGKRADAEALVASLKEALASKASVEEEHVAALKTKSDEIALLEDRVQRLDTDLQFERRELGQQVDELRHAGQETIALYEERISGMEARRYELEDLVAELEAKAAQRAASPGTVARQASTAAEIDNESLREQVSHFQHRLGLMEDQLEDARATSEREETAARARVIKAKEAEAVAWKECESLKTEMETVRKEDVALKLRVEELVEALRENAVTLEGARADVEGLRAEVADLEGLKAASATATGGADASVETAVSANGTIVAQLKRDLEEAKRASEASERTEMELHEQLESLEREKAELEQIIEATTIRQTADQKLIAELQDRALRRASRDKLKKVASQEQLRAESPEPRRNSVDSDSSRNSKISGGPGKREQITGLKHIISGLEDEIRQWNSKCTLLEQENKLLESGTEQLQMAIRRLEATIDDRLGKNSVEGETGGSDGERTKRIETENELMKTRITDMEQKHARAVLDLNKEITELENLVESKIYREDDLERELERCKEKLARATRTSSKLSGESMLINGASNGTIKASKSSGPRPEISIITAPVQDSESRCELCDSKDHDGMDCPLLHDTHIDEVLKNGASEAPVVVSNQWCEDCEEFGHTVQSCPNSQDVF